MNAPKDKISAARSSVLAAVFLTGMKLLVGLATGSLGILSEAAHSGLDLGAALMTWFAVRISDKPADETHHYGHGKIEGLSAMAEVVLLLITCGWIAYEALHRILVRHAEIEVNIYSFSVMAISIGVDISRSRMLYRAAKAHKSQALEADALHFASDIWSSVVVIVGLVGYKFLHLKFADSLAALVVSVLVIVISLRLALRTADVLLDKAPQGLQARLNREIAALEGVEMVEKLRVRTSGAATFIDMKLMLASNLSFIQAHQVATSAEQKALEIVPGADVIVHADPAAGDDHSTRDQDMVSEVLQRHRDMFRSYHDLQVVHHDQSHLVSMHLVMFRQAKLAEVHQTCDHLERDIKRTLPDSQVTIHVEPCKDRHLGGKGRQRDGRQ